MRILNKSRFIALLITFSFCFTLLICYAKSIGKDISSSVLRLHILANSDLEYDQQLKLLVRDRVLTETESLFKNAKSPDESAKIAEDNLQLIKNIAEDEIKKHGFDYSVDVSVENTNFPTKSYSNITLPCGNYTAVRIKIGEANGKNWWCVMYPPLCFADGIVTIPEAAKAQLKSTLSDDEYNLITKTQKGTIPVEIRFKIIEIFQNIF